jgi:hypothetical protein
MTSQVEQIFLNDLTHDYLLTTEASKTFTLKVVSGDYFENESL